MGLKVVLAYSGGLDTSVIVPWLREEYDAEVICVAADVGQPGGLEGLDERAEATGAAEFYGEDLRKEFVEDFVWPTLRSGAVYGRKYLLGTSMARPPCFSIDPSRSAGKISTVRYLARRRPSWWIFMRIGVRRVSMSHL